MLNNIKEILADSPALKGKDIAQKLKKSKREVNSFLHKNKDTFIQGEDCCWELKPDLTHRFNITCST